MDETTPFLEPQVKQYGSHMIMTNVTKPVNVKHVNIDTRFANNIYKHNSSYYFTLPEKITSVKSLHIKSVEIPNTFYNISPSLRNNTFLIKTMNDGSSNSIFIDGGSYNDTSSLMSAINTKIHSFTTDLNFNIDATNHSYFINTSQTKSFEIIFNTDTFGNLDKYNLRSKLGWILGFDEFMIQVPPNSTYKSNLAVNLNTIRYLYLAVDEFSNNVSDHFIIPMNSHIMNKKIIAKILLNNKIFPYGTIIYETEYTNLVSSTRKYKGQTDVQKLNIDLVNEWGLPIDLNGLDFSATLIFSCE